MLQNIFNSVIYMSITASVVTILIILFRWIFGNRLPKVFNYALWAIVFVRLIIPFSFPSMFSVFNAVPLTNTIVTQNFQFSELNMNQSSTDNTSDSYETSAADILNKGTNTSFPVATREVTVSPLQALMSVISWVWFIGLVGFFIFTIHTYYRASSMLKEAILFKNNDLLSQCMQHLGLNREVQIYTSHRINTPIVYGLLKARIILPSELTLRCPELELKHIISHELVHIKRFDYIIKPLSVIVLCVHWFNPIIWIGFILSQKDMEMSCDERVMSAFDDDIRSEYATSLINLASKQNILLNGGLLAFGESNIKSRIKGIMSFKKPSLRLSTASIIVFIIIGALLLTNGQYSKNEIEVLNKFDYQLISPSVPSNMKEKLLSSIEAMKDMGPGVGPWRIVYYNQNKIVLYNYAHIIACDISENNKGIYSIIELNDLNVGSYQGSVIATIYPSPDAMACVIGTGCFEEDYKDKSMSTYICNFYDSSVEKLEANFNMANSAVEWYRNMPSSKMLPWYVSIKDNSTALIWDVEKNKKLDVTPKDSLLEKVEAKFVEEIDIETGYNYLYWWKKDENTVIGAPYRKGAITLGELRLTDLEIIEINLKDKSEKILYKMSI